MKQPRLFTHFMYTFYLEKEAPRANISEKLYAATWWFWISFLVEGVASVINNSVVVISIAKFVEALERNVSNI